MHRAVADPTDRGHDACVVERAEALATRGAITLILHEPIDDATLFAFVGGLDVSVMANVWGTHSGWIEMCHDLGVRVVAPNIGFYGEQHAPVLYDLAGRGDEAEDGDAASEDATVDARRLAEAILVAVDQGRAAPADDAERRDERDAGARVHSEIYRASIPTR